MKYIRSRQLNFITLEPIQERHTITQGTSHARDNATEYIDIDLQRSWNSPELSITKEKQQRRIITTAQSFNTRVLY